MISLFFIIIYWANNFTATFTIIWARIHTVSHTAQPISALVADFICFSSPRAIISWYPFQTINTKHTNQMANHKYLFTSDIILYIERCHDIRVVFWENSPPVCHLRVHRVTAFTLDMDTKNSDVNIHITATLIFFICNLIKY